MGKAVIMPSGIVSIDFLPNRLTDIQKKMIRNSLKIEKKKRKKKNGEK